MIRRIVPVLAVAALLGACSSNSNNMPEPGSPNTSRVDGQGGQGGRGNGGGPGGQGGARLEEMALRGITLSSEQQQRVDAIRVNYRTQMEQARSSGSTDRTAMRSMMERQQNEIRAVLTTDQQAQFDRNIAEMRARQQQGGNRRPGTSG